MKVSSSIRGSLSATAVASLFGVVSVTVWETAPTTALAQTKGKGPSAPTYAVVMDIQGFVPQSSALFTIAPADGQVGSQWTALLAPGEEFWPSGSSYPLTRNLVIWLWERHGEFIAWDFTAKDSQGRRHKSEKVAIEPPIPVFEGQDFDSLINADNVKIWRYKSGGKKEELIGTMSLGTLRWTVDP